MVESIKQTILDELKKDEKFRNELKKLLEIRDLDEFRDEIEEDLQQRLRE